MKKQSIESPLVSIIILTYKNGLEDVKKCLNSLMKVSYKPFEVIFVDNASTDETVKEVSSIKYKVLSITLIRNKANLGFCRGNNQAAKIARGKYILLLNNDTEVTPNFLTTLVKALEKDKTIGVVQPKIRQIIEKDKLDACASFLTSTGFLYHYGYSQRHDDPKYTKRLYMYSAKGACFLTRKDLIDRIGLFDDDFFAYFEETDFCHRVWMAGFKVVYEPTAKIYHLGGANESDHPDRVQFDAYRNRIQSYVKNLELRYLVIILLPHILFCIFLSIAYIGLGRIKISWYILKAIGWNTLNFNATLKKRAVIQKKVREVSEKTYFDKIFLNPNLYYYYHFLFYPRGEYNDRIIPPE